MHSQSSSSFPPRMSFFVSHVPTFEDNLWTFIDGKLIQNINKFIQIPTHPIQVRTQWVLHPQSSRRRRSLGKLQTFHIVFGELCVSLLKALIICQQDHCGTQSQPGPFSLVLAIRELFSPKFLFRISTRLQNLGAERCARTSRKSFRQLRGPSFSLDGGFQHAWTPPKKNMHAKNRPLETLTRLYINIICLKKSPEKVQWPRHWEIPELRSPPRHLSLCLPTATHCKTLGSDCLGQLIPKGKTVSKCRQTSRYPVAFKYLQTLWTSKDLLRKYFGRLFEE